MNTSPILFVDLRIAREYFAHIAEGLQNLRRSVWASSHYILTYLFQRALWFLCFQFSLLLWYKKGYWWHILTKNLWVSELLLYLVTFKKFVCPVSPIEIVYLKSMYMISTGIWILTVIPRVFQTNLHETNNTYNTLSTNLNTHISYRSVTFFI